MSVDTVTTPLVSFLLRRAGVAQGGIDEYWNRADGAFSLLSSAGGDAAAAYNVDDMVAVLPANVTVDSIQHDLTLIEEPHGRWRAVYGTLSAGEMTHGMNAADAYGRLYLWAADEGLV